MLDKTKKYVSEENLKTYTAALNDKHKVQTLLTQAEIDANTQKIDDEISRASKSETILQTNIDKEQSRAETKEQELDSKIDSIEEAIRSTIATEDKNLNDKIDDEIRDRKTEIDRVEANHQSTLRELDLSLQNIIKDQADTTISTARSEFQAADSILDSKIITEANTRYEADTAITNKISEVNADLQSTKSKHNNLDNSFQAHISNTSNPHNVTLEQLGGAAQTEFTNLKERVSLAENNIASNDEDISTINTNITEIKSNISSIESDIEDLNINKVTYTGNNQTISGGITSEGDLSVIGDLSATGNLTTTGKATISGDVKIKGNLVVDGKHQTVNTETLEVQDNFIVVNSDNEDLGTSPAGIAIQTGETPYLIAYDDENDSVSLGEGVKNNNTFNFKNGERKPILTRAHSNILSDKHILVWDSTTKTAIDGQYGIDDLQNLIEATTDTYTTWEAYNTLVGEVHDNDEDILALQNKDKSLDQDIATINANAATLKSRVDTHDTKISNLESTKQDKTDSTLKTSAKTVVGAINENKTKIDSHILNKSNPHEVKWSQINSDALSNSTPLMDGSAAIGSSVKVSREDHIHPTDTSRAPVNHASASTTYGAATKTNYGHVRVDDAVSTTSTNTIQTNIITKYVDAETTRATSKENSLNTKIETETTRATDAETTLQTNISNETTRATNAENALTAKINALDYSNTGSTAKTITSISQTDGKISATFNNIQIGMSQVTGLTSEIQDVRNEFAAQDALLQSAINAEANTRLSADNNLQDQINDITDAIKNVKSMNDSIQDIVNSEDFDPNHKYILTFNVQTDDVTGKSTYLPIFSTLDDGELS